MTNIQTTITLTHANGSYPILIGQQLLSDPALLKSYIKGQQALIVTNPTVAQWYLAPVETALSGLNYQTVLLPDGESYKQITTVTEIWNQLLEHSHHRDTTLLALGGGVIGDMTGFAAACYQRGVSFIQIPTTLLAQADASIGGKTGVDHPLGKNMIGAFHQPSAVLIDVETLSTLPDRAYRAGLAEIVKAALIKDARFFSWLETHLPALLAKNPSIVMETLQQACQIKCDLVSTDEKEKGQRALLNLGHTFGHAIEQNLNYQDWLHGEAVALGILMAADLSAEMGWLMKKDRKRIRDIFTQIGAPFRLPAKIKCDRLLATFWKDKKVLNNTLHFILLKGIGHAEITTNVSKQALQNLITQYL